LIQQFEKRENQILNNNKELQKLTDQINKLEKYKINTKIY